MSKQTIIRDANGNVINIGPWDCMVEPVEDGDDIIHNPMPEGAYEDEAEIQVAVDGGLFVED